MTEKKRPPADDDVLSPSPEDEIQAAPSTEPGEGGFFDQAEHDGWGPIKRRTPEPPEPKGVL